MKHEVWNLSDVLDSMDGIAYAIDAQARIIAIGAKRWNEFSARNGDPELTADSALWQNLYDIVQGDDVRGIYRRLIDEALNRSEPIVISSRCDSPGVKRELRLSIAPLRGGRSPGSALIQSLVMDEAFRPSLDLFDFKRVLARFHEQAGLPLVTLCSFCQRVLLQGSHAGQSWVTAEDYYHSGGSSDVRLSHGLCPECKERLLSELSPKSAAELSAG